jgi:type IV pilus assembly protein PilM
LDYQIIPDGADSVCGVLVAATNKAIRRKGKLVKDASLNPVLMDVDGLALLNCLMQCEGAATDQALAVLNVGDTYTTLVIAGERGVPFVRDTNNAGADIIKNISEQTEMSRDRIYNILFNDDISAEEQSLLERALEECCEILIDDVTGTLRFYAAQKKILPVEKIYVCGGFARAKGFVDILDRRLPANAVLWNPFDKIPCRGDKNCEQILQKEGPALAVAAGLAMRSI